MKTAREGRKTERAEGHASARAGASDSPVAHGCGRRRGRHIEELQEEEKGAEEELYKRFEEMKAEEVAETEFEGERRAEDTTKASEKKRMGKKNRESEGDSKVTSLPRARQQQW